MKRAIPPLFAILLGGCFSDGGGSAYEPPPPPPRPPAIRDIRVDRWPPLGPNGAVEVRAEASSGLASVRAKFARTVSKRVSGRSDTVRFLGSELGEGYGAFDVDVFDTAGLSSNNRVNSLLVDLSPPEAEIGPLLVRANGLGPSGSIRIWGADAWALHSIEAKVDDRLVGQQVLPSSYPSTLGNEWDQSELRISGESLGLGARTLQVAVDDAAGNRYDTSVSIFVDGVAPVVALLEPTAGAHLTGTTVIHATAVDAESGGAMIEVRIGGAYFGTLAGPEARMTLDVDGMARGESTISVVAIDRVGNTSPPTQVAVTID